MFFFVNSCSCSFSCVCGHVGVSILKRSIRLYSPFYSSDIIIASPLGLRTVLGVEGEKKRDFDFLSSIEVVVLDQADVLLMQNWEHVLVRPQLSQSALVRAAAKLPWNGVCKRSCTICNEA